MMAISGQTYRSSPYSLPPPGAGRITSRPVPYSSPTFPLQQQYNLSPPANNSGLSFQNSMLLPGLQAPSTTSSLQLPDSPSHDSAGGVLPTSGVVPRRHSTSSHGSPLPPSSPIMEEESSSTDQYKSCSYRSSTLGPVSMNATMSFNSFSSPYHNHHSMSLPMPSGMGYHPNPPSMCPSPMYTTQDSMCSSVTQPLSISPMCYPTLPSMNMNMNLSGNSMTKLSLDTPRYKLTPERAIPLIKWFEEHKEHPYPTRHEKMLLCQSTQLTYTQVSTWFANARRRMKKANSEEEESRSNHSSSDEQNSLESPIQPS